MNTSIRDRIIITGVGPDCGDWDRLRAELAQAQAQLVAENAVVVPERRFYITESVQCADVVLPHDEKAQWKREKNRHRRYYK